MTNKKQTKRMGYTYVTEDEYNEIRLSVTRKIQRKDTESAGEWLRKVVKSINTKMNELEINRDGVAYQKFIEVQR